MSFFEILILLVVAFSVFTLFRQAGRRKRWMHALPAAGVLLVIGHLLTEGGRWQMVPLYVLSFCLFVFTFSAFYRSYIRPENKAGRDRKWFRLSGVVLSLIVLIFSCALLYVFPLVKLPVPGGKYAVGTRDFFLADTSRKEILTEDPDDVRKLWVKVWYPASGEGANNRDPYIEPAIAAAYAEQNGFPLFAVSHLQKVKTNTIQKAPFAVEKNNFPVLIFSHGLRMPVTFYASFLEEMASHGFIVVGISHTYETAGVLFPNGRLATYDVHALDVGEQWVKFNVVHDAYMKSGDKDFRLRKIYEMNQVIPDTDRGKAWADDISFVADHLFQINYQQPDNPFYGKLDLDRLGAFGHSYGGMAVGQAMVNDPRIKAGVNLDGVQWGDILEKGLQRPLMALNAVRDPEGYPFVIPNPVIYKEANINPSFYFEIEGTGHSNFSDIPLLISLPQLSEAGSVDFYRGAKIINQLTVSFFNKYLLSKGEFPETAKKFPEVR